LYYIQNSIAASMQSQEFNWNFKGLQLCFVYRWKLNFWLTKTSSCTTKTYYK